jgi:hypothetical protein
VIDEGTAYAPQMPWYMSHYCDAEFTTGGDAQDPVCYADYLSPFNVPFAPLDKTDYSQWPASQALSVFPFATGKPLPPNAQTDPPINHCPSGQTTCTLVMAGFDLSTPLSKNLSTVGGSAYSSYNNLLFQWFNDALKNFQVNADLTKDDFQRHFPWNGPQVTWGVNNSPTDLYAQAQSNPFLGQFSFVSQAGGDPSCSITLTASNPAGCTTPKVRADHYLYPRQCELSDLAGTDIEKLRRCGLNYEFHHNGWLEEWPQSFWSDLNAAGAGIVGPNQYGRTSFLFAGIPGLQLPVSFSTVPTSKNGLTAYEQVYNASIFSVYLPIANEADFRNALKGRNYKNPEFYHTLLMTNHMESDEVEFAEGIRGKVLWHNEYRTQGMYANFASKFVDRTFPAAFLAQDWKAPYHNNTCDGCHVRNGSGIPINPDSSLDKALQSPQGFMSTLAYNPFGAATDARIKDYTFTGEIRPMKLVFFDLKRPLPPSAIRKDDSVYSTPLAASASQAAPARGAVNTKNQYYSSTIMNFYGDSFHLNRPNYNYSWSYGPVVNLNRMVVKAARTNQELEENCKGCGTYQPLQVNLQTFTWDASCQLVLFAPLDTPWPKTCDDIGSDAIFRAINSSTSNTKPCGIDRKGNEVPPPCVGFMLLNGKRLGNLSAIEAIPDSAIEGFQKDQIKALGAKNLAGEVQYNAGSRDGVPDKDHPNSVVKECQGNAKSLKNCYIGRFGWLGDRVSLEDQVANAAFIEMNLLTSEGYNDLSSKKIVTSSPIRYNVPNCGPADQMCVKSGGNGQLLETDINRMAAYARWLGNPTRSEFMIYLPDVIGGEQIFEQMKCDTCHVIKDIEIIPDETMLSKVFRDRLTTRLDSKSPPFVSYLGTDLLMHDMGYLSQVGNASGDIRDNNGVVKSAFPFPNYIQKIRTPPLKGLRFNRFVTDSQLNTQIRCSYSKTAPACEPGCDFLLHDGRACDAIEAAFLHDGPAIKKLGVINGLPGCVKNKGNKCGLNDLTKDDLRQLRAFLYSL